MIARDLLSPEMFITTPLTWAGAIDAGGKLDTVPARKTDQAPVDSSTAGKTQPSEKLPFSELLRGLIASTPAGERLAGGTVAWRFEAFALRVERRTEVFSETFRYRLQEKHLDPGRDFHLQADRQGNVRASQNCRCPEAVNDIFREDHELRHDFHKLRGLHSLLQMIEESARALKQALQEQSSRIQPVDGQRIYQSFSLRIQMTSIHAEFS